MTTGLSQTQKARPPVCHFGRGILTGAMDQTFGRSVSRSKSTVKERGSVLQSEIGEPAEITRIAER